MVKKKEETVEEAVEEKSTKELKIKQLREGASYFEIYYEGGGELPQELTGLWTEKETAQKAIDNYLVRKGRK